MARTTKEQALKTRGKIIETAIEVFYTRGVNATTLEQIASAAGLTRGAIYWNFRNKLDLVSAVHEHFHLSILNTIQEEMQQQNTPPLQRMRNTWAKFIHDISTNSMYQKVMTIFMLRCDYAGDMAALLTKQLARKAEARALLATCFQAALDKGDLKPIYTADQLVQSHMCYMHGILYEYLAFNKIDQLQRDSQRLIDFHFNSLPYTDK